MSAELGGVAPRPAAGSAPRRNPWLPACGPLPPGARIRLFCLPYAGGGASTYRAWPASLGPAVEVLPVRLPGREMRLKEPPATDRGALLDAMIEGLRPAMAEPFALFGHSMGALLAHELTCRLVDGAGPPPRCLFVSGRQAPQLRREVLSAPQARLSDEAFLADLRVLHPESSELFANPALFELLLPVLRADFTLCQSYVYVERPPLPVPIVALGGLSDPSVNPEDLTGWADHTTAGFSRHLIPGDHFFLNSAPRAVQQVVLQKLSRFL